MYSQNPTDYHHISSILGLKIPTISILKHSSTQPEINKNIMLYFSPSNPLNTQWHHAAFEQYDKNASYYVFG